MDAKEKQALLCGLALKKSAIRAGIHYCEIAKVLFWSYQKRSTIRIRKIIITGDDVQYQVSGFAARFKPCPIISKPSGYKAYLDKDPEYKFCAPPVGIKYQDLYADDVLQEMCYGTERLVTSPNKEGLAEQGIWYVVHGLFDGR